MFRLIGVFVLLLLCGCQSEPTQFLDESEIPHVEGETGGGTSNMGERYPHIIIDGAKLTYDAKDKFYHFAEFPDHRAMWFEYVEKDGIVERKLVTHQKKDGIKEDFVNGKWVKRKKKPLD